MMRIGYFADGVWAHQALDRILQRKGIEIAFITPRFSSQDPVLKKRAGELGVPYLAHADVNSAEFRTLIAGQRADLLVSMSFDQILKKDILTLAPLGFINCHAGALPFYRGRNILNWAIINGEERFGVTVHHVDTGIDTGDIILQRFAPIGPDDDYAAVLDRACTLCAETLDEAVALLAAGKARRQPQREIDPVGFYCTRRVPGDEWLDWTLPSARLHNFIRGITRPGPCARTRHFASEVAIVRSRLVADARPYLGNPGEVVGRDPQGIIVKTGDSTLRITQVAEVAADGTLGADQIPTHAIGTRFGTNLAEELKALRARLTALEKTR